MLSIACGMTQVLIPREGPADGGAVTVDARVVVEANHERPDASVPLDASMPLADASRDASGDTERPVDAARDVRIDSGDAVAPTAITAVSAGDLFACALKVDGSIWCWGSNDMGELGAAPSVADLGCGAAHCNPTPQQIPTIDDATEIALGIELGCAIRADRSVWCWGQNDFGQLGHMPGTSGDGTCSSAEPDGGALASPCNPLPQRISLPVGVQAAHVSAGWGIVCVDTQAEALGGGAFMGDVYCWGNNAHDTIGLSVDAGSAVPTPNKIGVFQTDVVDVDVSGDNRYACAVRHDGSVWCWGDDYQGRIGALEGSGVDGWFHPTPVQVHVESTVEGADAAADAGDIGLGAPLANVRLVRVGDATSCALKFDGTVWCWGNDSLAGLGDDGPYNASQHPGARQVPGLPATVALLYRHGESSVAVDGTGAAFGWGDNSFGELAQTTPGVSCQSGDDAGWTCVAPATALPILAAARSLATGEYTGLMLKADSTVWAWGANDHAELGHLPSTHGDGVCTQLGPPTACNAAPGQVIFP